MGIRPPAVRVSHPVACRPLPGSEFVIAAVKVLRRGVASTLAALSLALSVAVPLMDTESSFRPALERDHDPSVCAHHDHSICTQFRANHHAPTGSQASDLHLAEPVAYAATSTRDDRAVPAHFF